MLASASTYISNLGLQDKKDSRDLGHLSGLGPGQFGTSQYMPFHPIRQWDGVGNPGISHSVLIRHQDVPFHPNETGWNRLVGDILG